MPDKLKVALLGSGNWGCAIARIVGWNVQAQPDQFEQTVPMYVYEETVRGRKLTEIINTQHENVKYLPGYKLPENIVATPDAAEAAAGADVLVINMPHQVLPGVLKRIKSSVKPGAIAVSLIKGHVEIAKGRFKRPVLGSAVIHETLGIPVGVLMGANVAKEVARGDFCEATISIENQEAGELLRKVFHRPNFMVRVTADVAGTELCGGLKNVVALAVGFCDGIGLGTNAKAAIIRIGLLEMSQFIRHFFPSSKRDTMFESCGVADLITTSFGGRNRKCAEAFARNPKRSWADIERDLLGGQKLQGVSTACEIMPLIQAHRLHRRLPLLCTVYRIAVEGQPPSTICDFATDNVGPGALVLRHGEPQKKVCLLGSGNWGSCIARVIGRTCDELEEFEDTIRMYVHEEVHDGRKLTDIINTEHENVKYLPGYKIPENVVAYSSATEAARDADVVVICLPHQYLPRLLKQIVGVVAKGAFAVSLIKGHLDVQRIELASDPDQPQRLRPCLGSTIIKETLGIHCAVLMGANVANEIARGDFSETTIATQDPKVGEVLARLFHLPRFQVSVVRDVAGVELVSGLSNVIALGAGFCDGLGLGGNTKAAIIRVGLLEIAAFTTKFFPEAKRDTLFESCGVGDLICMSFGGRNRLCAEFFANACERMHRLLRKMNAGRPGALGRASERGSTEYKTAWRDYCKLLWADIESEVLGGQYIQGIRTLKDIWPLIEHYKMDAELPLIRAIHRIAVDGALPSTLVQFGSNEPVPEPTHPPTMAIMSKL
eukprot:TRINITY_DN9068_c0_g1_i1.p1 TRINITY_DN9068_c0_g1~~TRINITY_DN9068_c0_g1_i1.p1  ORF type:complete len:809 (+),score=311.61 TRINITY_DN9068_c0_g1_i1:103-2427(+)